MEITWLGHSCFRLRSDDLAVVTDPFPDSIGLCMGEPQATMVTISHAHENHSWWQGVGGEPKVLSSPGEYELSGIYVTGVMTPHGGGDPETKRNTAYVIEMENFRLCHLGDVSEVLSTRQVEEMTPVDVLLMPVGGICTVDLSQAMEMVRRLEPRAVIPMHYSLPDLQVELGALDPFLREMGIGEVQPQARLNITRSNLPPEMRVVILEAQGLRSTT